MFIINDENDLQCYSDPNYRNQNRGCSDFLDDSTKTFLNVQTNRKIDFLQTTVKDLQAKNLHFIIDNTKFPDNGAFYEEDFQVEVLYYLDLKPSNGYYLKAILCKNFTNLNILI